MTNNITLPRLIYELRALYRCSYFPKLLSPSVSSGTAKPLRLAYYFDTLGELVERVGLEPTSSDVIAALQPPLNRTPHNIFANHHHSLPTR